MTKPDKTYLMARLCEISYKAIITKNHLIGLSNDRPLKHWSVQHDNSFALIVEYDDFVVVAFRGTDDVKDWHDNLNASACAFNRGSKPSTLAHTGFQNALSEIDEEINKIVVPLCTQKAGVNHKKLYITGHSLGGAMAVLYSSLFAGNIPTYTFGQPRVFKRPDWFLSSWLYSHVYRFTHADDIVPHLPSVFMDYRHVGRHYHFYADGRVKFNPNYMRLFWRFLKRTFTFKRGIEHLLIDHDIKKYVKMAKDF